MNRTEIIEKVKAFCQAWWDSIGDYWSYHAATATLAIVAFAIASFFAP